MSSVEWVEIIEPRTKEHMFANLSTGECVWDPPVGVPVKKTDDNQWWELFDQNTARFYYYNATSQKTVWHKPGGCDIIPLAKLQTLKQNTEPREERGRGQTGQPTSQSSSQTSSVSRLSKVRPGQGGQQVVTSSGAQTSPSSPPARTRGSREAREAARCRTHSNSASSSLGLSRHSNRKSQPAPGSGQRRVNGGHHSDRRSLDGAKHSYNNNGGLKYYSMPVRDVVTGAQQRHVNNGPASYPGKGNQVPISKQRSLEGENFKILQSPLQSPYAQPSQDGSLSRSISFMVRNGDQEAMHEKYLSVVNSEPGRRSMESTPQSGRRYNPLHSPEQGDHPALRSGSSRHGRTSHGAVDGFPTPMINRRTHDLSASHKLATSESEDSSQSPAKERRGNSGRGRPNTLIQDLVDSGLSTLTEPDNHRSNHSLNHRDISSMKERSLTSLSLQVKKPKLRGNKPSVKDQKDLDRSPSLHKISPLQHYILEQAKLSGYRFGDKIQTEKRDSFIDSENESHRTGDDSDAFADDEAPSSDGMEERDDISLISTVSSVGEDCDYLSEPTYNNLDPVWAQRHGPLSDNPLDIDAFSEEFDMRMRFGRGPSSTCSTIPRPTFSSSAPSHPPPPRPGSAALHQHSLPPARDCLDSMSASQMSDKTGSTLSVSASIHSTLSAGTLTDFENFAASNLNIQKKGLFRKKMSLKDVLSWQDESISKPLTFVNEKQQKKEAVGVFKLVQIYMSDRKAKVGMTINGVAQDIAEAGYGNICLRDEIYIQLCKQVSDNPRRESLRRGWELLAICLGFFPPSETFQPYLLGFIQKHRDPNMDFPEVGRWPLHVQISHYAGICNKRLERMGAGGRLSAKKPSLEDIDQSRLQIFRPSMFGGTLAETLDIQKDKFPNRRLPWILTTLTEQILALNGLSTEGIFRIPADYDEVMSVKCRYDQWEPGLASDAHVPAALLKQWLRELYVPLIPDDNFYNEAIRVGDDPELASSLVKKLPELHLTVLIFLIRFLQLFVRPEVVNITKMDASNLSMVFAPNFLRCSSTDPIVIMENTRKEMAFVKTLIHHLDTEAAEGIS